MHQLLEQTTSSQSPDYPDPDRDDPAFILYTSGSTGEPKGAVHRQADILYTNETFCRQVLQLTSHDRLFSSSRLPFAYGLGNSFSFPLLNGATTILCSEKPIPEVISRIFRETRPTVFFGVPVIFNLLMEHHRREQTLDCSSLRLCVSAGEALPAQLGEDWEKTFGVKLLDGIGSTEMLHMFMSNHEDDVRYGSSGKVLDGYEGRLLDEQGQPAPPNVEGHLWVVRELLLPAGCERAISIAAIVKATGFTWAAATTALSQVDNGCRQWRLKECCYGILRSGAQL